MSEARLREQFVLLQPALEQWGRFVTQYVSERVIQRLRQSGDFRPLKEFFKISPEPRVKTLGSFIAKALHRDKGYRDPMEQITDLVGVRFVVLLSSEMTLVGDVIAGADGWEAREDRNHEKERAMRPHFFDYESNHFIVKNTRPQLLGGVRIPLGLPCEIQVRTLLQHAYAELSHDRLYKPECKVPDGVRRLVARGSALLETTDNVFCQVSNEIAAAMQLFKSAHAAAVFVAQSAGISIEDPQPQVTFKLLESFSTEGACRYGVRVKHATGGGESAWAGSHYWGAQHGREPTTRLRSAELKLAATATEAAKVAVATIRTLHVSP